MTLCIRGRSDRRRIRATGGRQIRPANQVPRVLNFLYFRLRIKSTEKTNDANIYIYKKKLLKIILESTQSLVIETYVSFQLNLIDFTEYFFVTFFGTFFILFYYEHSLLLADALKYFHELQALLIMSIMCLLI